MGNTATIGTIAVTNFGCSANGTFGGTCSSTNGFLGNLTGNVIGNASTSTTTSSLTLTNDTSNGNYFLTFSKNSAGSNLPIYINTSSNIITYNPSTGTLVVPSVTANLTGAASQVVVNTVSTNTNYNIMMTTASSGNVAIDATNSLLYNPSTQNLTTGSITGNIIYNNTFTSLGSGWNSVNFFTASNGASIWNYSGVISATTNFLSINKFFLNLNF